MIIILLLRKNEGFTAIGLPAAFLLACFLKYPSFAASSVRQALDVCALRLIPALFPALILCGILQRSGFPDWLARPITPLFRRVFRLPGCSASAFLLGALAGFPIGAITSRALCESGQIHHEDAERLCAFTNNAGMAFCVGGIGAALYRDPSVGWRIYFSQLASSILIGILLGLGRPLPEEETPMTISSVPTSKIFVDSVAESALTMLKICAFAIFFGVIGDSVRAVIISLVPDGRWLCALALSFCELTKASGMFAELPAYSEALCAFAVGFAGLSVHMQIASVLSGSRIRSGLCLKCKLLQGILSAFFVQISDLC